MTEGASTDHKFWPSAEFVAHAHAGAEPRRDEECRGAGGLVKIALRRIDDCGYDGMRDGFDLNFEDNA
jgi:hypothetical protein